LAVAVLYDFQRLVSEARRAARWGADALEIRADCFPRSSLKPEILRPALALVREETSLPLIFTLRSRAEGGRLPRWFGEQNRLTLFRAVFPEVTVVDVELSAGDIVRNVVTESHKRGRYVILSAHNFSRTPSDRELRLLSKKARRLGGDIFKVAAKVTTREEMERLMGFCRQLPFRYKVFLPMGPLGTETRLQGLFWGSALSYGYVDAPGATGPVALKSIVAAHHALRRRPPA